MKNPTIYDEWSFLLPKVRANLATAGERARYEELTRRIVEPAVQRAMRERERQAAAARQQQAQRQARAAAERARAQQLQPQQRRRP